MRYRACGEIPSTPANLHHLDGSFDVVTVRVID